MRYTLLTLALAATIPATAACKAKPADISQVVEAMRTMYAAATTDDLDRFHTVAAPGFYAYDGGKRFSGDELLNLLKASHAAGKVFVWTVTEPEVHVDCDTAWITYVNRGSVLDASGTHPLTWLESAQLKRLAGTWRIQFLHSTRVP